MIQQVLILLIFLVAIAYMVRMVYQTFSAKDGCAKSCGACSTIDFKKIQKDLEKQQAKA